MDKTIITLSNKSCATIVYFDDFADLARKTYRYLTKGNIAISGGATFTSLYPYWIACNPDCTESRFFPVDERIVPFSHPQSNWGNTYRKFLKLIGKTSDKNHFAISVGAYLKILKKYFGEKLPRFDVIFLGAGADGHTASLFAGNDYLDDFTSVVLQTYSPIAPFERITLGPAVLVAAKTVISIIAGANKESVVANIFNKNDSIPLVRILSRRSHTKVFIEKTLI